MFPPTFCLHFFQNYMFVELRAVVLHVPKHCFNLRASLFEGFDLASGDEVVVNQ